MRSLNELLDRLFADTPLPETACGIDGTERVADGSWVPPFGQTWPSRWRDSRCVRCDGRRWCWSQAEARWLCAECGVTDPDRPLTRPVTAPEPAGYAPSDDPAGWPPEHLAAEQVYGTRAADV